VKSLEEQLAGLPKPTGENCPEHPTFQLVRKREGEFCRFGQHYPKAKKAKKGVPE
jgi:hypothetical protein